MHHCQVWCETESTRDSLKKTTRHEAALEALGDLHNSWRRLKRDEKVCGAPIACGHAFFLPDAPSVSIALPVLHRALRPLHEPHSGSRAP